MISKLQNFLPGFIHTHRNYEVECIDPRNNTEMNFWCETFHISHQQLNDAIIDTGSLAVNDIKRYLLKQRALSLFSWLFKKSQSQKLSQ